MALGEIAAGMGILNSLFGGGGGGGSGDQTVENVPWEGMQPYLTGESDYRPQMDRPLSSDWLYWNYQAGQGNPVGPPPPMFVDDPRYTGANVYDPPFQFQPARLNNPGYGDPGPYGSQGGGGGGPTGVLGDVGDYPSANPDSGILVPGDPPAPPAPAPADTGPSIGDMERAQEYMRIYNLMRSTQDGYSGPEMGALDALLWAQQNPDTGGWDGGTQHARLTNLGVPRESWANFGG